MRILLDTHILLWALSEPKRLSAEARLILSASENDILFSAANIWEIAIKSAIGRLDMKIRPAAIATAARESGFIELPVHADAASKVAELRLHHRDPFDRILVAQALCEPATLLTADVQLKPYSELVRLI